MIRRYIIWRNNHAYDERLRRIRNWPGGLRWIARPIQDAQGPSSMPRLRSIAQITTSVQAVRLPISTFRPRLLPDPVAPPNKP